MGKRIVFFWICRIYFLLSTVINLLWETGSSNKSQAKRIFNPDDLEVYNDKKLGDGRYGIIYQGRYRGASVACKQVLNPNVYCKSTIHPLISVKLFFQWKKVTCSIQRACTNMSCDFTGSHVTKKIARMGSFWTQTSQGSLSWRVFPMDVCSRPYKENHPSCIAV